MISREEIIARKDLRKEMVHVPEWGGEVFVRVMTGRERTEVERFAQKKDNLDFMAKVVQMTVCNENGELLFKPEDVETLSSADASPLLRVVKVANRINKLTEEEVEASEKN